MIRELQRGWGWNGPLHPPSWGTWGAKPGCFCCLWWALTWSWPSFTKLERSSTWLWQPSVPGDQELLSMWCRHSQPETQPWITCTRNRESYQLSHHRISPVITQLHSSWRALRQATCLTLLSSTNLVTSNLMRLLKWCCWKLGEKRLSWGLFWYQ